MRTLSLFLAETCVELAQVCIAGAPMCAPRMMAGVLFSSSLVIEEGPEYNAKVNKMWAVFAATDAELRGKVASEAEALSFALLGIGAAIGTESEMALIRAILTETLQRINRV